MAMLPSHAARQTHGQSGQALVLGILLLGVIAIAINALFSTGRLIGVKARQLNTVDAAAYSGALIQARALNMQAYINIAQIGHQMAMAHLVTLGSWAKFSATQGQQASAGNPPAYLIGMMFGSGHLQAYQSARKARAITTIASPGNELFQAFEAHDKAVHQVLQAASLAIDKTLESARNRAIEKVILANYPESHIRENLSWEVQHDNLQGFSAVFEPTGNYRSLIGQVAGVYRFLDERNHVRKNAWMVNDKCPWKRHELRRRGQTVLDEKGNWQSIDTESYHALRSNRWIGCYFREYPMGWGWVPGNANSMAMDLPHTQTPPDNFSGMDFWRWVRQATQWNIYGGNQNPLANSRAVAARQRWQGGGLANYVDIANAGRQSSVAFTLSLTRKNAWGHDFTVNSRAQTFFERPQARTDRRIEKANFWHPFWQARLVDTELKVVE
ncbi:MAG: hypothetical protein PHN76_10235 [Advenella sp.]|nr:MULTISPECIES: hypothetical protein [Advenella]MDD3758530.1 hypothetical protein [Advenella sp.]